MGIRINIRTFGICFVLGLCISQSLQHPIIAKREVKVGEWTKLEIPQMTEELPNQKLELPGGDIVTFNNGNYQGPAYEEFVMNSFDKDGDSVSISVTTKFPEMTINYNCADCQTNAPTAVKIVVEEITVNLDAAFTKYGEDTLDEGKVERFDHQFKTFKVYINGKPEYNEAAKGKSNELTTAVRSKFDQLIQDILAKEMQSFSDAFMITFKAGFEASAQLKTNIERPEANVEAEETPEDGEIEEGSSFGVHEPFDVEEDEESDPKKHIPQVHTSEP